MLIIIYSWKLLIHYALIIFLIDKNIANKNIANRKNMNIFMRFEKFSDDTVKNSSWSKVPPPQADILDPPPGLAGFWWENSE